MDRISSLPDDFVLRILSLLPTKHVLSTNVLSNRWRYLWKRVPKLQYIDSDKNDDHDIFLRFVDRSLLLNTAPVLESLYFKLDRQCSDEDIGFWIRIAVERGLCELNFEYSLSIDGPSKLPQSLYTCGTLVVLKLEYVSLVEVQFPVCFQLLKTLHLVSVYFLNDESPQKLLSSCPVLEDLVLDRINEDNVKTLSIMVPSLQRFIYDATDFQDHESRINTPSVKYLKVVDRGCVCMIEYMPEIVEAHVEVICSNTDDVLRSLASVKRLFLCFPLQSLFPTGLIFHQLVNLELCICKAEWDLLLSMLQHSPKLRSLKLSGTHGRCWRFKTACWDEPSSAPETLMFVLETFEFRNYQGWKMERDLAAFILKHSKSLKTATFYPQVCISVTLEMKYEMITELARLARGSPECQLVFG